MPKREQVAPFVRKTFEMISDRNYAEIVSWADDGLSFIIWKPQKFRKKIIPLFFKHNNLCSFVRQLNTYGFHKVSRLKKEDYNVYNAQNHMQLNDDILEFQHQYFLKSRKDLLTEVVRKKKSKSKSKATAEAKEVTPAKAQSQNNESLLLDSPNSNSSATDNSPCTSPESFPISPRSPYHRKLSSDEINESSHNNCHSYLMQQMQLNEEKMRMKEESKKLYSTISYLTYQVQLLSSELKNSQEKIRELESDLFVATNRMSPFDQNNSNKNTNNPNNNPHHNNNNNNSFTMNKRRRLHDGVTSSLTYYSDLSLAQYYPDFQNSFFIQDQFAGLS